MKNGNLILQVRKDHHFKIECTNGDVIEVRRLYKNGSNTILSVKAPKDYKIIRFVEKINLEDNDVSIGDS